MIDKPAFSTLYFILIYLLTVLNQPVGAQQIGGWQAHVSHSEVQFVTVDSDNRIWGSTSGGMIVVNDGDIVARYSLASGLYRVNPTALVYDEENNYIWRGYNDATIERINVESGAIVSYGDIRRSEPGRINTLHIREGHLYISMAAGIVVFDTERGIVRNSYLNLGEIERGSEVRDIAIHDNTIFAATGHGIAAGDLSDDLADPANWRVYDAGDGLADISVNYMTAWNGEILAFTGSGTYTYDAEYSQWGDNGYFGGGEVISLTVNEEAEVLLAIALKENEETEEDEETLYKKTPDLTESWVYEGQFGLSQAFYHPGRQSVFGASLDRGILELDLSEERIISEIRPEGPFSNVFTALNTDGSVLISGSSQTSGTFMDAGFYIFADEEWQNFNRSTSTFLRQQSFRNVFRTAVGDSAYYFGSFGLGVIRYDKNSGDMRWYGTENSPIRGFETNSSWVVLSGLAGDGDGGVWMTSWTEYEDAIYRYDEITHEFESFKVPQQLSTNSRFYSIMADSYGQLWSVITDASFTGRGVAVMRPDGEGNLEAAELTDDSGSGNLRSEIVNDIIEDRRGEVWIGTNRGIAQFSFPDRIIDGGAQEREASLLLNADTSATSPFLLHDVHVNAIEVNAANEKWIGTQDAGLWLIRPVGGRYEVVEHFTENNSPLISDHVTSLALDNETGVLYIATDIGLTSYTGTIKAGVAEMDELKIFPNPYNYNEESGNIIVEGLADATKLNVLTSDGRVINRIETRGGRIEWDGRDFRGNRVGSGVYVLVAVDENNGGRGTGKVVIIR